MKWWKHVMAMEFRKILAYRSDFWITFLGQIFIQVFVARALWQMIFESQGATEMKGYTLEMMFLYYLIVPIGTRILTGENIGFMAREIYEGTFNRYLLYPLSVFQYKTLTYLSYSFFYAIQLIIIFLLYRGLITEAPITITDLINLFLGTGIFLLASMSYLMMAMMIELISLWADNIWSLAVMMRFFASFFGGGFLPLNFMPSWAQSILAWTPFPYLISLPARTIMGRTSLEEVSQGVAILLVWTLIFMGLVKFIWNKGEKNYAGVGV